MTTIWTYYVDLLALVGLTPAAAKPLLIWGGLSLALNLLQGRRTQIEDWCKMHPRVSGFLQMLRGLGIDPVKIVDGFTALVTGNWQKANKGKFGAIALFLAKLSAGGLVLLALSCSAAPPQLPPMACPIPSQYLSAIPAPAAVASAVQDAQGVVEQVQVVAEDPTISGLATVAAMGLATVVPICEDLHSDPCREALAKAKIALSTADASREQICGVVALLVAVLPVERVPAELATARELCR